MTKLIAIDPGKATGWARGYFDDETPFQLEEAFVTHDGIEGFAELNCNAQSPDNPYAQTFLEGFDVIVYETFVLRQNGFLAALNSVEINGYLKGTYGTYGRLTPQSRTLKHHTPDATLKQYGFWQTGKMVGHKDGRDANDAIIHALTYLKLQGHVPTLKAYFPEELA